MDRTSTKNFPAEEASDLLAALKNASPRERSLIEEEIVQVFLPFAARLASRFRNRGVDLEDLTQVANMALVKAIRRFDEDRGEFVAFAAVTVTGEIKKHFRDYAWSVRPPRSIQDLQAEISATTQEWMQSHGAEPTADELVEMLGGDGQKVAEARAAKGCFRTTSLDAPIGDAGWTLMETIEDDRSDYGMVEDLADLAPVCRNLSVEERQLIEYRFFREMTQLEIGKILGVSQMQVSRRLGRLTKKLRAELEHPQTA